MAVRCRVIVAEDEALIALDLERILTQAGYDVLGIAVTAGEAVRLADALRPDVALIDARLARGSDGLGAVRDIRNRLDIPAIVVTGHLDEAAVRAAGAFGYLRKPYRPAALIALIEAVRVWRATGRVPQPTPAGFLAPGAGPP